MYIEEKRTLVSKQDGLELSVLLRKPVDTENEKCLGVVQIVHGMSEYKERYRPFMEYLAAHHYASIIHDHRGHGESVRNESDYGYMYEAGTDAFLEDIVQVNELAKDIFCDVPLIMLGHSMGSMAARCFVRKYDSMVDTLILSGPPCRNPVVDAGILLANILKKLRGGRHVSDLLQTLSFANYKKPFAGEKSDFAWICSDPHVVDAYDKDPKCGFPFTVDGFQVLYELLKRTYTKSGWKCDNPGLPILFLGGIADPCIDGKEKFEEEIAYMKRAGYKDVKGILYEGMRHEILNETGKEKVFADVELFLKEQIKKA